MTDPKDMVRAGYDAIAETYETWAQSFESPALATLDRLLEHLGPRSRVLDLGCGNGVPHARALVEHGHEVVGVDSSVAQLERARRNVPGATFVHGDALAADFPAGSFDRVLSAFVFGHIPRDEHLPLLERVRAWLRPGGRALITFGLIDEAGRVEQWLGTPMFFSAHPPERSRALLAEAGLELEWDREIPTDEPGHGSVSFIWTLSRRPT